MQRADFKRTTEIVVVVVFFSVFMLSLLKPVQDPDLFWHLKTGEWIWQNKTLPNEDPFTFTAGHAEHDASTRALFLLKQYWLSQIVMYGFYSLGGLHGIIALRVLSYLGIVLFLYFWMGRNGAGRMSRLIFLMPSVYFSLRWLGERPNNFSFFFAVTVVFMLEGMKNRLNSFKSSSTFNFQLSTFTLPLVMLVWANMHGGFILGDAIIILYMMAASVKLLVNRGRAKGGKLFPIPYPLFPFFIVCLISIAVSFINPGTYKAIPTLIELGGTEYSSAISEMMSPFKYAKTGDYSYVSGIGIIILICILRIKQFNLDRLLLLLFLVFIALTRVRYIPFLLFIATPFIYSAWEGFFEGITSKPGRAMEMRASQYAPILIVAAFIIFLLLTQIRLTIFKHPVITPFFPEEAAEFIKRENPEPELFNDYGWGGYLIWSLYPEYKVFIDGRVLFHSVFTLYNRMLSGPVNIEDGIPEWKAVFNKYRVKAVLVPGASVKGGGFIRLVRRLVEDNEWGLVFVGREALLFIKDTDKNREIIRKYSIPKLTAYAKALEQAEFYRAQHPDYWKSYATLGEINLYMGRPDSALLYFESAFRLNPSLRPTSLGRLVEEIKTGRDHRKLLDEIFR